MGVSAGRAYSATCSSTHAPLISTSHPCHVRILDLAPPKVYVRRRASSVPSFSAVPERSLSVMGGELKDVSNRHSQSGLRRMMRVPVTVTGFGG